MTEERAREIAEMILDFWDEHSGYDGRDISREVAIEGIMAIYWQPPI